MYRTRRNSCCSVWSVWSTHTVQDLCNIAEVSKCAGCVLCRVVSTITQEESCGAMRREKRPHCPVKHARNPVNPPKSPPIVVTELLAAYVNPAVRAYGLVRCTFDYRSLPWYRCAPRSLKCKLRPRSVKVFIRVTTDGAAAVPHAVLQRQPFDSPSENIATRRP